MKHILKFGTAAVMAGLIAFSAVPAANAKTPPEVLTPYQAYRAALKKGDNPEASSKAYEAWRAAEKALGDSKATGDLAFNYADVDLDYKTGTMKTHKKRVKAFKRSIELASFHEEDAADIEIDRRLKLAAHGISLSRVKKHTLIPEGNLSYFNGVKKALETYGKLGTTYEADYKALLAQYHSMRQEYDQALVYANESQAIFDSRTDKLCLSKDKSRQFVQS